MTGVFDAGSVGRPFDDGPDQQGGATAPWVTEEESPWPRLPISAQNAGTFDPKEECRLFLLNVGLEPTPDAIDQLAEVFLPCLGIMCGRPWDPNGGTWRKSGILGAMTDAKKKWERFWERTWKHGKRHDDSGFDLINYIGFVMRSDPRSRWGEWGEPGEAEQ